MSKSEFRLRIIKKDGCKQLLEDHHYLSKESKGFKSGFNYGLFKGEDLVGVCIFTGFPVPELAKGCFGLERHEQNGLFELSRLCLSPSVQGSEHNITSWFVSRAIKRLRKDTDVRAILSYADTNHHEGIIYKACNFTYYGLTTAKKDFWIKQKDGSFKKHSRGKTKGLDGEWRSRSRKMRFLIVCDKSLECKWR